MADMGRARPGPEDDATDFIARGGEMAERMRAFDWAASPLGPAGAWPQSLKTAVRIMLTSRFAMWMAWGPELTFFCNDAYLPTVGLKRDWVLGARSERVWAEIWPDIGPRIARVLTTGEATWDEALLLFLERRGFPEETYHTFSYSPLADDGETVVGMLCVVSEETERVVGERRLRFLRDLGSRMADVRSADDVWAAVEQSVEAEPRDFPFVLAYAFDGDGARLACRAGLPQSHPAAPERLGPGEDEPWGLDRARAGGARIVDVSARADLPSGPWDRPPALAVVAPLAAQGEARPIGALVAALNPHRPNDAALQGFVELFVARVAAGLAAAGAYEAERRRAETLAELDRAKTAFFSNVSHEFRTPLTLMLGPLEEVLERRDGIGGAALASVETAHRNGLRLLRLVNALLDFSRIEAGRAQARFEATDLAALTAELASSFRSATDSAGLRLLIDCPPADERVFVDRDMWEKIVLNLVSNAFKFTFEGEIEVALKVAEGEARLTVRDTGTGIAAEELPRLFERFHRIEGAKGRSFEGSGIGLALVQELVRLHQGEILVRSEAGRGSTFSVSVPLGSAHLPAQAVAASGPQEAGSASARTRSFVEEAMRWLPDAAAGAGIAAEPGAEKGAEPGAGRVLVADDNADLRGYIARLLAEGGYEVAAVEDGAAALARARSEPFDLLVTDVMMPGMDGPAVLRAIRADAELRSLPVIMLSARAGEEAELEGIGAGADDYLTKPFSARELLARVAANIAMARTRREATAALAESEARFRNMADHAPVMMWVTDPSGACTYLNRAAYAFLGLAAPEGLGRGWLDLIHEDDRPAAERAFADAVARRAEFQSEHRLRRADGAWRWVVAAAAPRLDDPCVEEAGLFRGHVGSLVDITDRKEAEALLERRVAEEVAARAQVEDALRQAQKMEAVGQLTGGIAHDFNNLLTGIGGSLELLQTRLDQGRLSELPRYVAAAQGASKRAAALTHRLLAFSRRQALEPRPTNVNKLVAGMEELIRRTVGPAAEIEVVGSAGLWTTLVDPGQLEGALLNLCINARDAMPDGGRITIETANRWLDGRAARERELPPGQYVSLSVTDTGVGMSPEVAARAFDPFFTTKPIGQGTGLGLSMIYGFTRQSGGQVRIYSEPGHGTTMCLYLPRCDGPEEPADEASAGDAAPRPARGRTVLVVDDEATVRMLVCEALGDLGCDSIEAADGAAGLAALRSDRRIDLLVTDVGLPGGVNGRQVAEEARALRPGIKVLFITGYAENAAIGAARLEPGTRLLNKPFTIDALAARIGDLLEAPPAARSG
jgi:PAS domain S-box-containing protein